MADQAKELDVLIRARYPLIYLVSWEEKRAEALLARLALAQGKTLLLWSATQGLHTLEGAASASELEPKAILDHVERADSRTLFVLKDFHPYMQDAANIRRLRDLSHTLKASGKTLILLSPQLTIPVELEKDFTVVDYDLPKLEDMQALLDQVTAASREGSRFPMALTPEERVRLAQSLMGLTLSEAESVLAKAIVEHGQLSIRAIELILQEIKQIIRKSRLLEYFEAQESLAQVGGLTHLKQWLTERGYAFSPKAAEFGLPQPRGVLLLGVQGCGKSMTCKAIASHWKLPLLRLDMGSIFGGFIGQSEENMRKAIKTAESVSPCILWLDEIEKGLAGTGSSNVSDAGTTARVFSTFLTWLNEKTKPVFIAATANNIQLLPPELLRKGRLDEIFFIDLPSRAERKDIWTIHLTRRKRDPAGFPIDKLVELSEGFSGSEIEQILISGLYQAFAANRDLQPQDLENVLATSVPLSRTMNEEIDRLRAWSRGRARPASQGDSRWADPGKPGFSPRT